MKNFARVLFGLGLGGLLGLAGLAWGQQYNQPTSIVGNLCAFNSALPTITTGFPGWMQCDAQGRLILSPGAAGAGGFPSGATPITAVFSGADTSSATATLPAAVGKFTYICSFNVSALGATAATSVSPTIATVASGNTLTYAGGFTFAAGATVGSAPLSGSFSPCLPASAVNSGITLTLPGAAGNTSAAINLAGYQL